MTNANDPTEPALTIAVRIGRGDRRTDIITDGRAMLGDITRSRDPETGRLTYHLRLLTDGRGLVRLCSTDRPKSADQLWLFEWARQRWLQRQAEEDARIAAAIASRPAVARPDGGPHVEDCTEAIWRNVIEAVSGTDGAEDPAAIREQFYCAIARIARRTEAVLGQMEHDHELTHPAS